MNTIELISQKINYQKNNAQQLLVPMDTEQHFIKGVIEVKNSPEDIFQRVPLVTEAIASYLKEPDYSHFVAAIKRTTLRPLRDIYQAFHENNLSLAALRPHERQLCIALHLQEKKLSDELKKNIIVEFTLSGQQPYTPFPLDTLILGCIIPEQDYHAGIERYLDYYDGDTIQNHFVENNPIARALLKWKKAVTEQNDAIKRIFSKDHCITLNIASMKKNLLCMGIYKTELNDKIFATLLDVAHRHFNDALSLPEKYGLAFAMMHLATSLKKNKLPALSEAEIDNVLSRYPRLRQTGTEILAVSPGKTFYRRT